MNKQTLGVGATLISATYFGFLPILMRNVYAGGANTLTTSFFRFVFSLIPLYIYLKIKKTDMKITKDDIKSIILVTVLGYGGTTALLFGSYNFIPSGMSTTIHFLYPTFTLLGCIIFLKDKPTFKKVGCVILSLIGVIMFYDGDAKVSIIGMGLAFLSSITYSFYTIYLGNSRLKNIEPLKLIFYMNIVASIMYLLLSISFGGLSLNITTKAYIIAIIASVLTTFVGVFGYQIGVKNIGSENTAILSTFEPITSVILGLIIYDEGFTIRGVIGIVLILTSTIIIAKNKENK